MTDDEKTASGRSRTILVCGESPFLNALPARCGQCNARIWPTAGSLKRAREQGIPLICVACYMKVPDCYFGGFMDHGAMLDPDTGEKMFAEIQTHLAIEMERNRRGPAPPPSRKPKPGS